MKWWWSTCLGMMSSSVSHNLLQIAVYWRRTRRVLEIYNGSVTFCKSTCHYYTVHCPADQCNVRRMIRDFNLQFALIWDDGADFLIDVIGNAHDTNNGHWPRRRRNCSAIISNRLISNCHPVAVIESVHKNYPRDFYIHPSTPCSPHTTFGCMDGC